MIRRLEILIYILILSAGYIRLVLTLDSNNFKNSEYENNEIYSPALLGGMLTLQSCEHFLDTKPTETYSEELVWGSRSTADAFVLRTYPDILGLYHDFWGDDQITLNTILRQSCPGEARDLINREHDFGFNKFSIIRRCNLIIEQASASTALSDLDKKELVAEGKMLRAMIYYYQAKHCGRVIWVDRVLQCRR